MQNNCTYGQETSGLIYHIVKNNEDIYRISLRYKVPIDSIQAWNNLDKNSKVNVGQRLVVSGRTFITTSENNRSVQLPDILKNPENASYTDSALSSGQNDFLPLYSELAKNDKVSTLHEKILIYYNKSSYFFKIILFLNLFFLVSVVVLCTVILIRRLLNGYVEYKKKKCQNRYRDFITDWLYEDHSASVPESLIKELNDWVYRDVFTSELLSLHSNLTGESAEKLVDLFHLTGLKKYSIQKVHSFSWHVIAKGFRELAQMKITEENRVIFKYLNSKNIILSIEAQMAWIQLNPDDPLSFYDDPKVQLSEWGQLNALISLKKGENIPDFRRWLKSPVKLVALFALKMSGIYKQFDNVDLIIQRLDDTDREIRHEAICALGKLSLPATSNELQQLFPEEEIENKTEIVRALIMMSESSNVPFFEEVLLNETEINLRIVAAKGLVSLDSIGIERLDSLNSKADPLLQKIIIHAKDDRI